MRAIYQSSLTQYQWQRNQEIFPGDALRAKPEYETRVIITGEPGVVLPIRWALPMPDPLCDGHARHRRGPEADRLTGRTGPIARWARFRGNGVCDTDEVVLPGGAAPGSVEQITAALEPPRPPDAGATQPTSEGDWESRRGVITDERRLLPGRRERVRRAAEHSTVGVTDWVPGNPLV